MSMHLMTPQEMERAVNHIKSLTDTERSKCLLKMIEMYELVERFGQVKKLTTAYQLFFWLMHNWTMQDIVDKMNLMISTMNNIKTEE